ncbi:hypothetical protein SUGI_0194650 [Cryptomeria japonica]|nr:hypothetical protein SUGI_0194650 [Cryptomeria japonica]
MEDQDWVNQVEAEVGIFVVDYIGKFDPQKEPIIWKTVGVENRGNSLKLAEILKGRKGWNLKQSSLHKLKDKSVGRKNIKWFPPPLGWKKLNFDGASRGNLGLSSFGAVVRDEDGILVGAICGLSDIVSNNVA